MKGREDQERRGIWQSRRGRRQERRRRQGRRAHLELPCSHPITTASTLFPTIESRWAAAATAASPLMAGFHPLPAASPTSPSPMSPSPARYLTSHQSTTPPPSQSSITPSSSSSLLFWRINHFILIFFFPPHAAYFGESINIVLYISNLFDASNPLNMNNFTLLTP